MATYLIRSPLDVPGGQVAYDSPRNRGIDWTYLDDVLAGKVPPDPGRLDAIDVYAPSSGLFESLWIDSRILVSDRLRRALEPACERDVEFVPLLVNGRPFFGLLALKVLDVLDREHSELKYFRSNPDRVMSIRRYAFKEIGPTRVFKIPEDPGRTFAREPVRQAVVASRVPGLRFVDCEDPPPDEGLG